MADAWRDLMFTLLRALSLAVVTLALAPAAYAQVQVQVEVVPPPPPVQYVPPRYAPPPPPPPPRVVYVQTPRPRYRRVYYVSSQQPWIRPKPVRGTIGVSGFGTILANQRGGVEYLSHGGGLALWGGVEIGRVVGIEGKFTSSFHNPVSDCTAGFNYVWCDTSFLLVQTLSLDLKLHIPTDTRFVPYFVVGPMVGWIGRRGYLSDAVGGGFEAGGGFDIWFSRHGTIGFEVLYRGLLMSDYATVTNSDTYLSLVQIGGTIAAHF